MKTTAVLLVILLMTSSVLIISASTDQSTWKQYPYYPPGTSICFPIDEGIHTPINEHPKEWWYANFHLTGTSTGDEYGVFVSFFKGYPARLFSISDITSKKMYSNVKAGLLMASKNKLDLSFISMARPLNREHWYTKTVDGNLLPFQYKMIVNGRSREDRMIMGLDVDMNCIKPPMIAGGDGIVNIGDDKSFYYSQTKIEVTGSITLHGLTEDVTGYAWIDHQWGNFNINSPHKKILWEWFSIKLNDSREIMVGDTWQRDTKQYCGSFSDGLNLFNADNSLELLKDYKITPLNFWTDPISKRTFAIKWRITEPSKQIDLIVTADYSYQVGYATVIGRFNHLFLWEGTCSVEGTVEGKNVNGKAYVESSHSWDDNILHRMRDLFSLSLISTKSTQNSDEDDGWYYLPSFPNYAPSGLPDFSEKQQEGWRGSRGGWTFCAPTSMANIFWWFDSKHEDPNGLPGDGNDTYPLVKRFNASDDHSPDNVNKLNTSWEDHRWNGELIEKLAWRFNTNKCRCLPSRIHDGTSFFYVMTGIRQWIRAAGLQDDYKVTLTFRPSFSMVNDHVRNNDGVMILLRLYNENKFPRVYSAHYVSVAGIHPDGHIAISDPISDKANPCDDQMLHNDASIVSHDIYGVDFSSPCPRYSSWQIQDYWDGIDALAHCAIIISEQ